ncbi:peptidylprolyl isomerase [Nocardioides sp.]|uniref:peptidylprolyl isomerase n=1 Tax=Nocardioides sp. TaxID=35761 RepID=UPI002ED9A503
MLLRLAASTAASAAALALLLGGCGSDGSDGSQTASDSGPTVACTYTDDGQTPAKDVDPPAEKAPASGTVRVDLDTSIGHLGLDLDAAGAPCTVNSFVSLAQQGYFDDTSCHRLTTEGGLFVLQCGDPTGTGSGGPGYSYPDELEGDETYPAGTLAMANSGPDTNGSQFFIVYADSRLDANYTVFGTIDEAGLKAVQQMAQDGNDGSLGQYGGAPNTPVDISSVEITD